jgi:hypothetical protein
MARRLTGTLEPPGSGMISGHSIAPDATADKSGAQLDRPDGPDEEAVRLRPIGRRKGETTNAADIALRAGAELAAVTGLDADRVSAVERRPDGWRVVVDLVELRRIPAATDVLAAYEAEFGPTGILLSYRRTRRYFRDQMTEEK